MNCSSIRTGRRIARPALSTLRTAALGLLLLASLLGAAASAQPGTGRVYVHRIEFTGVSGIDDKVLRRQMLQYEGTYLNTVALQQSLRRLERLPYIAAARADLKPVPGSPDEVDVIVAIKQTPARRYGGGGGYSPSLLASLHLYFTDENLFGTGRRFSARLEGGTLSSLEELSYGVPYARPAPPGGITRNLTLASRQMSQASANASNLDVSLDSLRLDYGYETGRAVAVAPPSLPGAPPLPPQRTPIVPSGDTTQRLHVGVEADRVSLKATAGTSAQLIAWMLANGHPEAGGFPGTRYDELTLRLDWRYDTRDRSVFPRTGLEQTLSARAATPLGGVEYFLADYHAARYWPIAKRWTAALTGRFGFGAAYGGSTSLPPYLNWFAGGPGTVRGFEAGTLGPRDSLDRPYGGNLLVAAQFDLLMARPVRWEKRLRLGAFLERRQRVLDGGRRVPQCGGPAARLRFRLESIAALSRDRGPCPLAARRAQDQLRRAARRA